MAGKHGQLPLTYSRFSHLIFFIFSEQVPPGPTPANILDEQVEFLPPPGPDTVPYPHLFGDVIRNVNGTFKRGDLVSVTFYGANPRHNMKVIVTQ